MPHRPSRARHATTPRAPPALGLAVGHGIVGARRSAWLLARVVCRGVFGRVLGLLPARAFVPFDGHAAVARPERQLGLAASRVVLRRRRRPIVRRPWLVAVGSGRRVVVLRRRRRPIVVRARLVALLVGDGRFVAATVRLSGALGASPVGRLQLDVVGRFVVGGCAAAPTGQVGVEVVRTNEILHVQERGALLPDVDEGRLHAGQHPTHDSEIEVAQRAARALALDVELGDDAVLHERNTGLTDVDVDNEKIPAHRAKEPGPSGQSRGAARVRVSRARRSAQCGVEEFSTAEPRRPFGAPLALRGFLLARDGME
jgi:hypothetical protein